MDNAVALVKSYLQINGYFTVVEYPIIEFFNETRLRVATDIDVLAYRFPHAGRIVTKRNATLKKDQIITRRDPLLDSGDFQADMIIGEVKESRARFNPNMFTKDVLRSAFMRFGCCELFDAPEVIQELLKKGATETNAGHKIKILVFGLESKACIKRKNYRVISLKHVVSFMQKYIRDHWEILRHAQFRDPGLGFLITLEKVRRSKG